MHWKFSPDAFWARLVEMPGGCRDWPGPYYRPPMLPYGKVCLGRNQWVRSGTWSAHRLAWTLAHGQPIPYGVKVCHSCDRPKCCESDHLWLGTQADNIADRDAKGRTARGDASGARTRPDVRPRGERVHAAKLTAAQARDVAARYAAGGVTLVQLATEYGMSKSGIWRVVSGETWRVGNG